MPTGQRPSTPPPDDLQLAVDAYGEAWDRRTASGDDSADVLLTSLRSRGLHEESRVPPPVRDLIVRLWNRGVPPPQFRTELRRGTWPLLRQAGAEVASSMVEVTRTFLSMGWTSDDRSWLELPDGHQRLSERRKSHDLVLRYFHKRAEQVSLPMVLDDETNVLGAHPMPSGNRPRSWEYPVWLRPSTSRAHLDVMVGRDRVGSTEVEPDTWSDLLAEARSNVYADGVLILPWSIEEPPALRCWLPQR